VSSARGFAHRAAVVLVLATGAIGAVGPAADAAEARERVELSARQIPAEEDNPNAVAWQVTLDAAPGSRALHDDYVVRMNPPDRERAVLTDCARLDRSRTYRCDYVVSAPGIWRFTVVAARAGAKLPAAETAVAIDASGADQLCPFSGCPDEGTSATPAVLGALAAALAAAVVVGRWVRRRRRARSVVANAM
jgi:hypothetical protein